MVDGSIPTTPPTTLVGPEEALVIVDDFLGGLDDPQLRSVASPELLCSNLDLTSLEGSTPYPTYYIVSLGRSGYAIVSADRSTRHPILGYSLDSSLDLQDLPCGLEQLLKVYGDQIDLARERSTRISTTRLKDPKGTIIVKPLLGNIMWNQSPFYNALCPGLTPVGCVSTAISQIMRFWKYPERGEGTHTYRTSLEGHPLILTADYNHALDWDNMPEAPLQRPNEDIARLCYEVAVGVYMNFAYAGSGAMSPDVVPLVKNHYKYSKSTQFVWRGEKPLKEWEELVRSEINAGRPVFYCGQGSGGGHAFVCDGYDDTNYFHFNWGWAGQANGWFILDALDPSDLGTGGGAGGYNYDQGIIIGLKPRDEVRGDNDKDEFPGPNEDEAVDRPQYGGFAVDKPEPLSISKIKLGNLSKESSASGYSDFTALWLPAKVGDLPLEITINHFYLHLDGHVNIWMDLNQDGDFSKEERLLHQQESKGQVKATLRVPAGTKPGDYRLRVVLTDFPTPMPSGWFLYGEAEDYNLTVIE